MAKFDFGGKVLDVSLGLGIYPVIQRGYRNIENLGRINDPNDSVVWWDFFCGRHLVSPHMATRKTVRVTRIAFDPGNPAKGGLP